MEVPPTVSPARSSASAICCAAPIVSPVWPPKAFVARLLRYPTPTAAEQDSDQRAHPENDEQKERRDRGRAETDRERDPVRPSRRPRHTVAARGNVSCQCQSASERETIAAATSPNAPCHATKEISASAAILSRSAKNSASAPNVPSRLSRMIASRVSGVRPPPKASNVSARPSSCMRAGEGGVERKRKDHRHDGRKSGGSEQEQNKRRPDRNEQSRRRPSGGGLAQVERRAVSPPAGARRRQARSMCRLAGRAVGVRDRSFREIRASTTEGAPGALPAQAADYKPARPRNETRRPVSPRR